MISCDFQSTPFLSNNTLMTKSFIFNHLLHSSSSYVYTNLLFKISLSSFTMTTFNNISLIQFPLQKDMNTNYVDCQFKITNIKPELIELFFEKDKQQFNMETLAAAIDTNTNISFIVLCQKSYIDIYSLFYTMMNYQYSINGVLLLFEKAKQLNGHRTEREESSPVQTVHQVPDPVDIEKTTESSLNSSVLLNVFYSLFEKKQFNINIYLNPIYFYLSDSIYFSTPTISILYMDAFDYINVAFKNMKFVIFEGEYEATAVLSYKQRNNPIDQLISNYLDEQYNNNENNTIQFEEISINVYWKQEEKEQQRYNVFTVNMNIEPFNIIFSESQVCCY